MSTMQDRAGRVGTWSHQKFLAHLFAFCVPTGSPQENVTWGVDSGCLDGACRHPQGAWPPGCCSEATPSTGQGCSRTSSATLTHACSGLQGLEAKAQLSQA